MVVVMVGGVVRSDPDPYVVGVVVVVGVAMFTTVDDDDEPLVVVVGVVVVVYIVYGLYEVACCVVTPDKVFVIGVRSEFRFNERSINEPL